MPPVQFGTEPAQSAFWESSATIVAYGGAMGGGKSRCLMEKALSLAIGHPGIQILVARRTHTSIIETTKKTFEREVLGASPLLLAGEKKSQGEDWVEIHSSEPGVKSRINFIGLDDVVRWHSAEIGALFFDEAHEIGEQDVITLQSRLRQRGMPHRTFIGFNPGNPGHWLQKWFILGAAQTEFGMYKAELKLPDAETTIGDAEFVFANAYANPHLPPDYIDKRLRSMPEKMRRRMLKGEWVLMDGSTFFDADALSEYATELRTPKWQGETAGDPLWDRNDRIRVKRHPAGPLAVWEPPVDGHRYIVSVDVSSGGSTDFSAIQVFDFQEFEQVAELQVKMDPDLVGVEAFRLGVLYNGAEIAPEVTGGYGDTVVKVVKRLLTRFRGPRERKPRLYMRPSEGRLASKFTDLLGFDTNVRTRSVMLDLLEQSIRERSLKLNGVRTHAELCSFAYQKSKFGRDARPAAISGENDDLVMALAIAVYVAASRPKAVRRVREEPHRALVGSTGY